MKFESVGGPRGAWGGGHGMHARNSQGKEHFRRRTAFLVLTLNKAEFEALEGFLRSFKWLLSANFYSEQHSISELQTVLGKFIDVC